MGGVMNIKELRQVNPTQTGWLQPYLYLTGAVDPEVRIVNRFGENSDIDTGTVPEVIWDNGGNFTFPTAAETVQVFSSSANDTSAGTGARTVTVTGLDANYDLSTETVTLNGTTPVTTTATFLRVNRVYVRTAGSADSNVGNLTVRQSITTSNVFTLMPIGANQSACGFYTIQAGTTGFLIDIEATAGKSTSTTKASLSLWYRRVGEAKVRESTFSVSDTSVYKGSFVSGIYLPEKTDLWLQADSVTANNTVITSKFEILLIRNKGASDA
jgi:hypothetical protein